MAARREKSRSVRQRIRDTKRLLSKEDLPETVRLSKERVLKCLATELHEQQQEVRGKKMNKRYRMVKFFDKRKVMRRLKVLQREWDNCTEQQTKRDEFVLSVEQARNELNYIVHYPPTEKYLALYPSTESTDRQAIARKEELLGQVAEMVSRGEISDASSYFLSPDLMAQLPSQTSPSIPAVGAALAVIGRDGADDSEIVKRLGKRGKSLHKAGVDEEPEGDESAKIQLATGDDFFLDSVS